MTKPITIYGKGGTPNPLKVLIMLEELGLPFETKEVQNEDLKKEPYESVNPNGRLPAIFDPNTDVTLFESGAIIEYLVETYDKEGKFTYTTSPEKYLLKSWLAFQISGQGPYFGQAAWFMFFHPEKLPSVIERYQNEIKRVIGVFERHFKRKGTEYLVGDKVTYVDLAFIPWNSGISGFLVKDWDWRSEHPLTAAWHEKLMSRPAVKKILEEHGPKV
ncbi:glutathione S-transferase [Patellaria atrata CBS 101060]|uniref:Glutathione S-transferase n=1 Tax=Patellaria atrata CBS 101060 TaxID=1346257 RepID=A0A9P4S6P5_9PEZI|nr:glutathione S-transferase [Patellaria atrata CBS 101060]